MPWSSALFKKDKFSDFRMEWTTVNPSSELGLQTKNLLLEHYPRLARDEAIYKIAGQGTINSANILVEAQTEQVVVKMLSLEQMKKAQYLEMINSKLTSDFLYAPRLIQNQSGGFVTQKSKGIFLLYEKLGDFHYSGKFSEFKSFLHIFRGFTEAFPSKTDDFETQPLLSLNCRTTLDEFLSESKDNKDLKSYREMLQTQYSIVVEKIDLILDGLTAPHYHQLRPLHIDLHPQNLSVVDEKLFFLDLEAIHLSSISRSLGFALYKLIRQSIAFGEDIRRFSELLQSKEFKSYLECHDCTLVDLKNAATQEVLRRLFILVEFLKKSDFDWGFVMPMHLSGLLEIDQIFAE